MKLLYAHGFRSKIEFAWNNDQGVTSVTVSTAKQRTGQWVDDRQLRPPPQQPKIFSDYRATSLNQNTPYHFLVHDSPPDQLLVAAHTTASSTANFLMEGISDTPVENTFDLSIPQGDVIALYTHTNQTIKEGPWQIADTLNLPAGSQVVVPTVSLIQSFLTPSQFEALASIQPQQGSAFLVAYQFNPGSGPQNPLPVTSHGPIDQVSGTPALAQSDQGIFVLLVFRQGVIEHYTHPSNTVQGDWTLAHTLKPPAGAQVVAIALAQSDGLGGFKAVMRVTSPQGDHLVGYEFTPGSSGGEHDGEDEHEHKDDDNDGHDSGGSWLGPFDLFTEDGRLIDHVTGSPALIQSINGEQERFELLVPIDGVSSYYTNSSQSIKSPWTFVQTLKRVGSDPTVAVSLIQARTLNLEAVARVSPPGETDFMVSYEFTSTTGWQGPFTLIGPDGNPIPAGPPPVVIG
jgi:hypothetical protein